MVLQAGGAGRALRRPAAKVADAASGTQKRVPKAVAAVFPAVEAKRGARRSWATPCCC